MSRKLLQYRTQLLESLAYQGDGDEAAEDRVLASLDKLWLSMSRAERALAKKIASELAQGMATTRTVSSQGYFPALTEVRLSDPIRRDVAEDQNLIMTSVWSLDRARETRVSTLCLSA